MILLIIKLMFNLFLISSAIALIFGLGFGLGYLIAWDLGRTFLQREIEEKNKGKK